MCRKSLPGVVIFLMVIAIPSLGQSGKSGELPHGRPALIRFQAIQQLKAGQSQQALQQNLGTGPNDRLQLLDASTDRAGYQHQKFQQFYKGIKVEYGVYAVHTKNGAIESISGEYYNIPDLSVKPVLSESDALEKARQAIAGGHHNGKDAITPPKGELLICPKLLQREPGKNTAMALAYKFDIYVTRPLSRTLVYVDAHTGEIIHKNPLIKHADGTAATRYSGPRTIQTHADATGFILKDITRGAEIHTYDMRSSVNYPLAVEFTDADNQWSSGEYDNAAKDNAALDAHWGATMTYDYFLSKHGRNSFDNQGGAIKSYVHYDTHYDNAFWDGTRMTYGDGDEKFDVLTSLDVVAHEIGHAVCQHTASLNYSRESGALNEGLSDIWGAMVERFGAPEKDTWLIGEEVVRQGDALRSMLDPNAHGQPDTYRGNYWYAGPGDFGGVHTNSGVLNHWYYLLAIGKSGVNDNGEAYNVSGIGIDKAADIVYRTESIYLTGNSEYAHARTFSIQAATDLYGAGSNEVTQTIRAWNAVGVYESVAAPSALEATVVSATSVALTWHDNSDDETGFKIERSSSGGDFELVARVVANTSSYTDTGLPENALFYYRIKAIRGEDLSPPSDNVMIILGTPPPTVPTEDSLALVALFDATNGAQWTNKDNWLTTQVNQWRGVTIEHGRVTHLSLRNNNLDGTIPWELGNCTALRTLDLSYNKLISVMPPHLGNLIELRLLKLNNNGLAGRIPTDLENLGALEALDLSYNKLFENIPAGFGQLSSLKILNLAHNGLTQAIPPSLGNLTALRELLLSENMLHGTIPPELGNLTSLRSLHLDNNQLYGEIPVTLANLEHLEQLVLSSNWLSGSIPAELSNLSNLWLLYLSNNDLTGDIPASLGNMWLLYGLDLRNNRLSGEIPQELGNLQNLYTFYLGNNALTGSIPPTLGNLSSLQVLDLGVNLLAGEIPPSLGNLPELLELSLVSNQLTGTIPDALGNLPLLSSLYLDDNQFTGNIPASFSALTKLRYLSVKNNKLSGSPESLADLKLYNLDLTHNQFTALPEFSYPNLWLKASDNKLTFESLEANLGRFHAESHYIPQDSVGTASRSSIDPGQTLVLSALTGGAHNVYQWTVDGADIEEANSATLTVSSPGTYSCKITNTQVTSLILYHRQAVVMFRQHISFQAMQTKTYGDPAFAAPAMASSGLDLHLESSDPAVATVAGSTITIVGVGTTTIRASQPGNYGYDPASPVQQTLVVNKGLLTATADNKSRSYGVENPAFTISYTGFVYGDSYHDITPPEVSTGAEATSAVGTYPVTLSGGAAANYDIVLENGSLVVTKAMLTVYARDHAKTYGAENPEFTMSFVGFVPGDGIADITPPVISVGATVASDAGEYPIVLTGGAAQNYAFNFVNGSFTIYKAMLTASTDDKRKTYGEANPEFIIHYSGFVNGDDTGDITPPVLSVAATAASDAGVYPLTLSGGAARNYDIIYQNSATLAIVKAPLTAKADDQSRFYGEENPEFTISYAGFINGDDVSDITPPIAYVETTPESEAGAYNIFLEGGSATNYWLTLDNSALFVIKRYDQNINFDPIAPQTFGSGDLLLHATATSGLEVSYTSSDILKTTVSGNRLTFLKPGPVTITASQAGNARYLSVSASQSFCINPPKPAVTMDLTNPVKPVLTSSASEGNQWFKDGAALAGANGITFTTSEPGLYTVTATADGCTSEASDQASFTITDIGALVTSLTRLYPNPVDREIEIVFSEASAKEIEIVHTSGVVIQSFAATGSRAVVDAAGLAPGVYLVRIRSSHGIERLKFVKR